MSQDVKRGAFYDAIYGPGQAPAIRIFRARNGTWVTNYDEGISKSVIAEVQALLRRLNHQ